ncbi:hypothetical protein BH11PSE10_BH11PSE10_04730 [soil metagenome]
MLISSTSTMNTQAAAARAAYELRFQSLFHAGRALAFPCNAQGDVCLDALTERARDNYLFARAVVGHEYATPVVQPVF